MEMETLLVSTHVGVMIVVAAALLRVGAVRQMIADHERRLLEIHDDIREIRTWVRYKNGGPVT